MDRRSRALAPLLRALDALPVVAGKPAADPVKVSHPEAVKGAGNIVIASFNVGFLVESSDWARAGGGLMGGMGGRSSAKSYLAGVTPQMMQSIADAAFADFKTRLQARGFTLVDPAGLYAHADYVRAKPLPMPWEVGVMMERNGDAKTMFFKPTAIPQMNLWNGDLQASGFGAMTMSQSGYWAMTGAANYARASGNGVVNVLYILDFSDAKKHGNSFTSYSSVKVTSQLSVSDHCSKITYVAPTGRSATISLNNPIEVGGDFATVADTTGGGAKAAEAVANVIGILGGTGTNKSRKYTFTAKPTAYEEGAIKAATLTSARLVDRLAALR